MSKRFIVIGNPISHSKSPEIHQAFAKQADIKVHYHRQYCPNDTDSFHAVVEAFFHGGGDGANVTVPFKQAAHDWCREVGGLTPYARVAGAVNTLFRQADILFGGNTDGPGLIAHLQQLGWSLSGSNVAIIGAGGAARGIILPLLEAGVSNITLANRTVSKAEQLISDCYSEGQLLGGDIGELFATSRTQACAIESLTGHYDIIINATSIGLSDERLPLSDQLSCTAAYDMMYGRPLPFLEHFAAQGAQTSDGYGMLLAQAALSFERWTGHSVDMHTLDL